MSDGESPVGFRKKKRTWYFRAGGGGEFDFPGAVNVNNAYSCLTVCRNLSAEPGSLEFYMTEEEYIKDRLEDQLKWYGQKSQHNQKRYNRLRLVEIVSAALIPFLAGGGKYIPHPMVITGVLGVVIAVCAGAASLYKFHENWIQYRTTAEQLKHEKFLYLTDTAPYDRDDKFSLLVERVESLISKENSMWAQTAKKQATLPKEPK